MTEAFITRRRTGWDIVLGALLVVAGIIILANAAIATKVSILFLGWMLLIAGNIGLISALFNIGKHAFWPTAITGALLLVLGLMFLRNTEATAVTLTLLAGALFLVTGIARLFAAGSATHYRGALIFGGAVATLLGLIVLFNLFDASYKLIGILIGIDVLAEGLAMMIIGRTTITILDRPEAETA
jgi:uncharacterized membrane protein HdeD (DUF308 family)